MPKEIQGVSSFFCPNGMSGAHEIANRYNQHICWMLNLCKNRECETRTSEFWIQRVLYHLKLISSNKIKPKNERWRPPRRIRNIEYCRDKNGWASVWCSSPHHLWRWPSPSCGRCRLRSSAPDEMFIRLRATDDKNEININCPISRLIKRDLSIFVEFFN